MRDRVYEAEWFDALRKEADSRGGSCEVLIRLIAERMAMGAETYGDNDFMAKDVLHEAREEAADLVAYAVLESQKRNASGRSGHHHLFEAAVCAALADWHLRRARDDDG